MTVTVRPRRIRAIHDRLRKEQGPFVAKHSLDPLDQLIATVLSQHTSDLNTDRAFASLKRRLPRWEQVLEVPPAEVADAIRSGGLADTKSVRIQAILREIDEREAELSLDRLHELPDAEAEAYLVSLPGVGPKTAACVLTFSMGRAGFPIDTHVERIVKRLGWVPAQWSADRIHRDLTPVVPPDVRYSLHMAFIAHGRTVCKAQVPLCGSCVLRDLCDYGRAHR